jgi:regulator of sirC expression with transglutaminase-like and TPR domain
MMNEKRKEVAFPKFFRLFLKDLGFSRADGDLFSSERDETEVQPEE